jgi:hypothetical protein
MDVFLGLQRPPFQFVVKCGIEQGAIATWIITIIRELLVYVRDICKQQVFHGTPTARITPRGVASSQSNITFSTTSSTLPGFDPIERGVDSGTSTASSSSSPSVKTNMRFVTLSKEYRLFLPTKISWMLTEVAISIIRLHYLAFEIEAIVSLGEEITEKLAYPIEQTLERMQEYGPRQKKYGGIWLKRLTHFYARHPDLPGIDRMLVDLQHAYETESYRRFYDHYLYMKNHIKNLVPTYGRHRPLVLSTATDVVLLKQPDFSYPLEGSFFDLALQRKRMGQGLRRLATANIDIRTKAPITTQIPSIVSTMTVRVRKDVTEKLRGFVNALSERLGQDNILLTPQFYDEVADVIVNDLADSAVTNFWEAASFTDKASGTTIQLRARKCIMAQYLSDTIFPLPPLMFDFVSAIIANPVIKNASV